VRKTLVLDTNLLVLLAVGLTDPAFIARHRRLYPTYRKEHFDRLRDFVERAPALATTTHVLTEASNLLRHCVSARTRCDQRLWPSSVTSSQPAPN
jgi:hypothetical protein